LVAVCAAVVFGVLGGCSSGGSAPDARTRKAPSSDPTDSAFPTGDSHLFTVAASDFQIVYRLDAVVAQGDSVGVDVPSGTTIRPSVESGQNIRAGDQIGEVIPGPKGPDADGGTVVRSRQELIGNSLGPIRAPVSGAVEVSAESARIVGPGLDVVVGLKPLQELRYRGMRFEGVASVETVLGQRRVPCTAVWLAPREIADTAQEDGVDGGGPGVTSVRCRLPDSVETAAGLPAALELTSQKLPGALVVPAIYVGLDRLGRNYVAHVRVGETYVERPVVVGPTDGVRRVVTSGISIGDRLVPIEST
jgi:hypothetical protein